MYIKQIILKDYRNYSEDNINFISKSNIIIGQNAQGKTNILEAIYFCAFGKSFRTTKDIELIRKNSTAFRIKIVYFKNNREQIIDVIYRQDQKKQILLNEVPLKSIIELIGCINVVLFSPEDLKLIKGGPSERRRFLDREISHLSKRYIDDLVSYHKILNQRNKLLKTIYFQPNLKKSLDVWDEQLVHYGVNIIKKRADFINKLDNIAQITHKSLTYGKETISVQYFSSLIAHSKFEYDKIENEFKKQLVNSYEKDIKYGFTGIGPHKDDLIIKIDDNDTRKYASQGQQRTAALTLKLSEIKVIEQEIGETPILLLDDVMSELDLERQSLLTQSIKGMQTIITTTDLHGLDHNEIAPFQLIEVEKGAVLSCQEVRNVD